MIAATRSIVLRPRPLAACLASVLALGTSAHASRFGIPFDPLQRAVAEFERTTGRSVGARDVAPFGIPGVVRVTNCDDAGEGSLRAGIASMLETDIVDLTHLACSRITLTTGALTTTQGRLVLVGPGADKLTIDGSGADRVIDHAGEWVLKLSGLTIANGATDGDGGCLRSASMLHLYDAKVVDCHAGGRGGAAYASTQFFMYRSSIADSTAATGGGAYSRSGFTGIVQSTLSGNAAPNGRGGGLYVRDTFYLSRSTLAANDANQGGGFAASVGDDTFVNVAGSTISANTATRGAGFDAAGTLRLVDSTLAFNAATISGGGFYADSTTTLQNSIVAGNTAAGVASDIAGTGGTTISGANNLVIASSLALPGDTLHDDPMLAPLADNGGETMTHALVSGSVAIDHGNNQSFMRYDQRYHGSARTIGAAPDIGAYERRSGENVVVANCLDAGDGSLRDAIASAKSGDTIDLSKLACGTIALTSQLVVDAGTLTLAGPGASALVLDGGNVDRVINHFAYGTLAISGLTLRHGRGGNDYRSGGCIHSYSSLAISDSVIDSCSTFSTFVASGGGLYARQLSLTRSTVSNNLSMAELTARAGGVQVNGNLTMRDSTITGNRAVTTYDHIEPKASSSAGGLLVSAGSTVSISGSTIADNVSGNDALGLPGYFGGIAIYGSYGTHALIENTTISGNEAASFNAGLFSMSTLTLRNSTIAFNRAGTTDYYQPPLATGLHTSAPWLNLSSTIIAGSSGGPTGATDLGGDAVIFGANNLVTSSSIPTPPDTLSDDPQLEPLADNGGATLTHALAEGSPAIDHGNNDAALPTDQRGAGSQRLNRQRRVGVLPRLVERPLDPFGIRILPLLDEALMQPEQGSGILRVPRQVDAEHAFGLFGPAIEKERGAKRLAHRIEENRRLVVWKLVGGGDSARPQPDRVRQ